MNNQNNNGTQNINPENQLGNTNVEPNNNVERPNINTILNGPELTEAVNPIDNTPIIPIVNPAANNELTKNVEATPNVNQTTTETIVAPTIETITPSTPEVTPTNNVVNNEPTKNLEVTPNVNQTATETVVAPTIETITPSTPEVTPINNVVNNEPTKNLEVTPNVNQTTTETVAAPTIETITPSTPEVTPINNVVNNEPTKNLEVTPNVNPNPTQTTIAVDNTFNNTPENAQDDFYQVPVPPVIVKQEKEKKEMKIDKKVIIIILVAILIIAIGAGVYLFLNRAKSTVSNSITTKELKLELGNTLSQNIDDYATISGYNKSDCTIDLGEVNINKVSTYKFYITCGNNKQEGKIIIDDTTAPELIVNDLAVLPNATIKAEDFIEECLDASECTYKFSEDYSNITSNNGEYDIKIEATDSYNNKKAVNAKLTVTENAPMKYLNCTTENEEDELLKATMNGKYKIGIDKNNQFYSAERIFKITFQDDASYENFANNYDQLFGFVGTKTYYKNTKTIIIKATQTLEEMESELDASLSTNANLLEMYIEGYGFTCN